MTMLATSERVVTVGAISAGSLCQRTMARLTPSSLKLSTASRATSATANVPNACGPSSRASTTPMARVLNLDPALLIKLQLSARDAWPIRLLVSPSGIFTGCHRWSGCETADGAGGLRGPASTSQQGKPGPRAPSHGLDGGIWVGSCARGGWQDLVPRACGGPDDRHHQILFILRQIVEQRKNQRSGRQPFCYRKRDARTIIVGGLEMGSHDAAPGRTPTVPKTAQQCVAGNPEGPCQQHPTYLAPI